MEISVASGETVSTQAGGVPQLPNHKVKLKKPGQRACNEKNDKGKFCGGRFWSPQVEAFDETEQIDHKRLGDDGAEDTLRE